MIDIEKLLRGKHVTVRWYGPFTFHNICGYGHCHEMSCRGCSHTNYYIVLGKGNKEYRLPSAIQYVLRKVFE